MKKDKALKLSLFILRITVFLVIFMWTLDKFLRPAHASAVFANFYYLNNIGATTIYIIGAVEMVLLLCFLGGVFKHISYGFVLVIHTISTLSTFKQYLAPFQASNLLFFAAWPMLGACLALFLLREYDTLYTVKKWSHRLSLVWQIACLCKRWDTFHLKYCKGHGCDFNYYRYFYWCLVLALTWTPIKK